MSSVNGDLVAHACRIAEELGPVFPVRVYPDPRDTRRWKKQPLIAGWQNGGAVSNPEAIEALFDQYPQATHVGVVTGERSHILAIDLDGEPGMAWWRDHQSLLPATRAQRTQRPGGRHLFYRIPSGCGLRNSASKLAPGVDIRADGGFIVDWSSDYPPDSDEIADAPPALIALLQGASAAGLSNSAQRIGDGRRHDALKSMAASLRRKGLKGHVLEAALAAWNTDHCDPPQDHRDVLQLARDFTVKDGDELTEPAVWSAPAVTSYGEAFDPAKIPLRQWLIRGRYARGEGTAIAGPPGTNKSTLLLTDAVQLVTGRSLLGEAIDQAGSVLFLVGEDRRRDFEARLAGLCERYGIRPIELGNRLHVVYQSEINPSDYALGQMVEDMATLNAAMFDWLHRFPDIVALFIDPMLSWHRLIENDNAAMQLLCVALRGLAAQANIAVAFDHHVTKVAMFDPEAHVGNLAALRGASAIAADMRWAFTMAKLKPETAAQYGIAEEDRKIYRRLDSLKASYGPEDDGPRLLRIESLRIANGEHVGVLVSVDSERLRSIGQERQQAAEQERRKRLGEALGRMLREKHPRSTTEAALWLSTHEPQLYLDERKHAPLSERTICRKLPVDIGAGLETVNNGKAALIVLRVTGSGTGARREIDFEQIELS